MRIKRSGMKQNNDIPDKIMERIRKLMRLKESTTSEGEARETALTCCHDALIDKYLEKIGTGGMAEGFKGKDHKLNRYVAVKVLKEEFRDNAGR